MVAVFRRVQRRAFDSVSFRNKRTLVVNATIVGARVFVVTVLRIVDDGADSSNAFEGARQSRIVPNLFATIDIGDASQIDGRRRRRSARFRAFAAALAGSRRACARVAAA